LPIEHHKKRGSFFINFLNDAKYHPLDKKKKEGEGALSD